jgi:hypothetical protein
MSAVKGDYTPSMHTISSSSIDLRTVENPYVSDYKTLDPQGAPVRAAQLSIREAIRLNDHLRIRKGSPGSCSQGAKSNGGVPNDYTSAYSNQRFKTLD